MEVWFLKKLKCIEGNCEDCQFDEICEQDGPTKGFTRWLDN